MTEVDMAALQTTDARAWAREFMKVRVDVDEGLMLAWFANAIECGRAAGREAGPMQVDPPTMPATNAVDQVLWECFRHFAHLDHANAAIHCASVRYSPITFRLAEMLRDCRSFIESDFLLWENVTEHAGAYAEDKGR